MTLKTCKRAVCASALMAVAVWSGGAFAAVSTDFESTLDAQFSGGTLGAGGPTSAVAGFPGSFENHTQVLAVTGTVTYTDSLTSSSANASQVDFMFKVEPTDELEDIADDTVQTALAVGVTNGTGTTASINLWCKDGGVNKWVSLKSDAIVGSWMRATLVLDYSTHKVRVSLDGDPIILPEATDAWYALANNGAQAFVKTISMVGSTEVDDFVVSHTALNSYTEPFSGDVAIAGTGKTISYDDLNKYGITVAEATADEDVSDGAGMTISEKLEAGLDPTSATKFELQTMTTTEHQAVITFPGANATSSYSVKVKDASNNVITPTTATAITQTGDGEKINTATIDLTGHEDELLYFTVETVTP